MCPFQFKSFYTINPKKKIYLFEVKLTTFKIISIMLKRNLGLLRKCPRITGILHQSIKACNHLGLGTDAAYL